MLCKDFDFRFNLIGVRKHMWEGGGYVWFLLQQFRTVQWHLNKNIKVQLMQPTEKYILFPFIKIGHFIKKSLFSYIFCAPTILKIKTFLTMRKMYFSWGEGHFYQNFIFQVNLLSPYLTMLPSQLFHHLF